MTKKLSLLLITLLLLGITTSFAQYAMPDESVEHEGTWLQWPHHYTYGFYYRNSIESTWIEMTQALVSSENVHIVAYNSAERDRISTLLTNAGIPLTNIDFFIQQNDDVWVRDNGPMFVYGEDGNINILDWGFNGWGNDTPFALCDLIPTSLAEELDIPVIDLSSMVLEGGAIEIDGHGTLVATRSSVTHSSRNPDLSEAEIENYFTTYMGITNVIWLDGVYDIELTDMHIDGFMRFGDPTTIVTMNNGDLLYWDVPQSDIDILYSSTNATGSAYDFLYLPLTQNNVSTLYGTNLGYKGSYCNYYIANNVVLVPNYNDANDQVANDLIQELYPERTVIGVDVRNLYENGGMIHCVTQQQPVAVNPSPVASNDVTPLIDCTIYPNPFNPSTTISLTLTKSSKLNLAIFNLKGQKIKTITTGTYPSGNHTFNWNGKSDSDSTASSGIYLLRIKSNEFTLIEKCVLIK